MSSFSKILKLPRYIKQKFYTICDVVQNKKRKKYMRKIQSRLLNRDFSLVAKNCNGGVVLHDLGLQFRTQFVNLSIDAADYIQYLENFDTYNNAPLMFEDLAEYPIGTIDNIKIHFIHYKSNEEALEKWNARKERINKDNMFVIFTEQNGCTYEHLKRFDNLDFPNKVAFTCKPYEDIKSAIYIKSYKNSEEGVYMFLGFKNHFTKHRRYDVFDWVSWFNGEKDLSRLDKQK